MTRSVADENMMQLLAALVGFDTTSRQSTCEIATYIGDTVRQSCPDARIASHTFDEGRKVNLILRKGPDAPLSAGLVLVAHLDVVPAAEDGWETDPFLLTEKQGRLFGRGATDMKSFLALALDAFCRVPAQSLQAPLVLLLTSDEEIGSLGAQALIRDGYLREVPRQAIIGEPTSLRLVRMHKGHLKVRFSIAGHAAHSGLPHRGDNAIRHAGPLITQLEMLRRKWQSERCTTSAYFHECPFPALNLGLIQGGAAVNIVADRCTLDVGIRLLPGQQSESAMQELNACVAMLPEHGADNTTLTIINDSPPMLCPAESAFYVRLASLLSQREDAGVSFSSDAGVLSREGVDCVLWGPGTMDDAHCANESIDIEEIRSAQVRLEEFIRTFCCGIANT